MLEVESPRLPARRGPGADELREQLPGLEPERRVTDWGRSERLESLTDRTIESMVDFPLRHADELKVFYFQTPTSPETQDILAECDRRIWDMASRSIRLGIEAGVFRTSDPELAALFIHEAIDGAVRHKIMYGIDVDRDRLVAAATEMARKLLAP